MAFTIDLTFPARYHLRAFRKRDRIIILDAIATHLSHQPVQPTRNRKKLEANPVAPWELRVGDFRIFYDVDLEREKVVVVAIGHKTHNRLTIGGEEIEL